MIGAPLHGVLLDLDGTIADSIPFFYRLACEMVEAARCPIPARADVLDAIANGHLPHDRFLPADLPGREEFLAALHRDHWESWVRRYGEETTAIEGAIDTVLELHARGLRLALVTSSSGSLPFLDRWDIRRCFDVVIGRQDVRRIKPDPEPLQLALARLELSAADAVSVGDTPLDVRAGIAAGIRTVGVLTGAGTREQLHAAGAHEVLPSLRDVPRFLDQLASAKDGAKEPGRTDR